MATDSVDVDEVAGVSGVGAALAGVAVDAGADEVDVDGGAGAAAGVAKS